MALLLLHKILLDKDEDQSILLPNCWVLQFEMKARIFISPKPFEPTVLKLEPLEESMVFSIFL